jgi:NitT/TauT family transport system substrate-binding protein
MIDGQRRRFCRAAWRGLAAGAVTAGLVPLGGCQGQAAEPLRIGAQVFPGYEFLFLARSLGSLPPERVRLVDSPSATASIRALGTGAIDGACLTLDEVMTARDRGIALTVVAVLDVSMGADAVLAHPDVGGLPGLRGRTLGVEQSAVGAIMLDALLMRAGLRVGDVEVRHVSSDAHLAEFMARHLDAVVTFDPVRSQLMMAGADLVYSSADIPGRIIDVIALRSVVLDERAAEVRALVDGHFGALEAYRRSPRAHHATMADRLHVDPEKVDDVYKGLELPDRARNRAWFANDAAHLSASATELAVVMRRAGLLGGQPRPAISLFDGRFL